MTERREQAAQHGLVEVCDEGLAAALRVLAASRQDSVCLCSGRRSLAYVESLRDGLKMSSRLIIHLDAGDSHLGEAVQQQVDADIRVAGHFQDIAEFAADISRHRIDLLVADVTEDNRQAMSAMFSLLNDSALLVLIASDPVRESLVRERSGDYFVASLGGQAILLTRKGRQHRLVRRGGRRGSRAG